MDFYAETEKGKQKHLGRIGQLSYERYDLSKKIEAAQIRIAEIDTLISKEEAGVAEADQAQRNFNTYLAVKEGAVTLDQIKEAAATGKDLEAPPGAVKDLKPKPKAEKKATAT